MNSTQELLESDLRGQTRVLKRLAQGASLNEVLHTLIDVAEESRPEMIASVLLVDEATGCLRNGASRRLPAFYCDIVDGTMPGPAVGSCGTAAYTGKRVIVEDIKTDPLWERDRDIVLGAGLQACWSEPIISSTGEVLGTFAMYYQSPRAPDENELEFVSSSANLAALAIERLRYQDKLLQAERLAAMGQMVTAIAHESRNALQRIQVGVDVLQYEIEEGSEARDDLDRISRAKADLQHLHDELRSFAGPIQLNTSTGNVAEVWRQAWTNLRVSRKDRDAQLVEEITDVELSCDFDAFRIEQVFRNLFENSLAACGDLVRIKVTCRNTHIDGVPGLSISVRDNGPGLPEEIRSRVFEAFHTTKAKGTGLGMAIAKRFVEAHHGTLELGNDRSGGAEFVIKLPRKSQ
ncbi:MAG: GAF domain-containing sensor histidine kinase [Pirellulaceae bacterium]|nr:GAF domain-containing sensor histidine kinase [Pirellulaceae bacterium]